MGTAYLITTATGNPANQATVTTRFYLITEATGNPANQETITIIIKPQGGSKTDHDFKRFPELTNAQMQEFYFDSPHKQIVTSFRGTVAKVKDGDTISVSTTFRDFDTTVRFGLIDTKELSEDGDEAKEYVRRRIEGKLVDILVDPENRVGRYGRLIGEVFVEGINLGQELINMGLATPFSQRNEGKLPNLKKELNIRQWL